MYSDIVLFPVMRNEDWMNDAWDPLSYGQDYESAASFYKQFSDLSKKVPQPALAAVQNENCEYCNNLSGNKNCYLVFNTSGAEDCMYCENAWDSKDCIECSMVLQSELCHACTYCVRCYNLRSSEYSEDCSDSHFLAFCRSCRHCFGCVNLRHKEYCIWNEQKTKEEYEQWMEKFSTSSWTECSRYAKQLEEFSLRFPRPHAIILQSEQVSGNFIEHSKNVHDSHFVQHGEDLVRCFNVHEGVKDCADFTFFGRHAELIYECAACGINIRQLGFCFECREGSNALYYCWFCDGCEDCFGCISLRKKRYCIFNKQYTKEEYEQLVPQIIGRMRADGTWGEFFPMTLSPYAYNHTSAQRYFPLTRERTATLGLQWHEKDTEQAAAAVDASELPDGLPAEDRPFIVRSELSGRPFRITAKEIERYRAFGVPLPRLAYDERMEERAAKWGGIRLHEATCAKSGMPIRTTYPPDSPYIIWDREVWEREFGS